MIINWRQYQKWKFTPKGPKGMCMRCKKWRMVFQDNDMKMYCQNCRRVKWMF